MSMSNATAEITNEINKDGQSGNFYSEDLAKIQDEIRKTTDSASNIKNRLLKHYLVNYILYLELEEEDRKNSAIAEKLTVISILLEKLNNMQNKIETINPLRVHSANKVDRQMMRNKDDSKKKTASANPRMKYKNNCEKLMERTKVEEDPNVIVKKSKKN